MHSKIAMVLVSLSWMLLSLFLLLDDNPYYVSWLSPIHFYMGIVLGLPVSSLIASFVRLPKSLIPTSILLAGSLLILFLEVLQVLSSVRKVELQDIVDGLAGIAVVSIASWVFLRFFKKTRYICCLTVLSFIAITFVLATTIYPKISDKELSCNNNNRLYSNWDELLISDFSEENYNKFTTGANLEFCRFNNGVSAKNGYLELSGGGLESVILVGLPNAIVESGTFTFGVRFRVDFTISSWPPSVIAQISSRTEPPEEFNSRFLQFGSNATASLQFVAFQRTGTSMPGGLGDGYHEIVISHDGLKQTTWLDGVVVGIEYNSMTPPIENDLTLEIGWRSDKKLQPFHGSIQAIYIGTKVPKTEELNALLK